MPLSEKQDEELGIIKAIFENVRNLGLISLVYYGVFFSVAKAGDKPEDAFIVYTIAIVLGLFGFVLCILNVRHVYLSIFPNLREEKFSIKKLVKAFLLSLYFLVMMFLLGIFMARDIVPLLNL